MNPTPRPAPSEQKTSPPPAENSTLPPMVADPSETMAYAAGPEGRLPAQLPAPFGRYQLQKLLGKGGMGAVFLAHDTQLDRPVALKMPFLRADEGAQVLARFQREARAAATVLHPNVCPVHDVGEIDGVPYLTMAYVQGKPLGEFAAARPLTARQSALLVRKLALAVQEAHRCGVVHRDLKPANILINKHGEPIVMDFGLARRSRRGDARLTQDGSVMGTPAYMPPEQVSGDVEAMGPACDIYALGVIFYELLAGRLPFTGDPMAVLSQVLLDEPPALSQLRPGIDPKLEAICRKAMAKKACDRHASMAVFAAALLDYLRGSSPSDEPPRATAAPPLPAPVTKGESPSARVRKETLVPPPKPPPPTLPARKGGKPRPSGRSPADRWRVPWWSWLALGVAAVVTLLAAWVIYRATDYGTLRIVLGDPKAVVRIKVDGDIGDPGSEPYRLRAGEPHTLEVTGADYEPLARTFTVERGANPDLVITLNPKFGTIRFRLSEAGAPVKLWIDGVETPAARLGNPLRLGIGRHNLHVSSDKYEKVHQEFVVRGGVNRDLAILLVRKPAPVTIEETRPPETQQAAPPVPQAVPAPPAPPLRFAAIWEKRADPKWDAKHNLTTAAYQKRTAELDGQGCRPVAISGYVLQGQIRYAAVWELRAGPPRLVTAGLTPEDLKEKVPPIKTKGYHVVFLHTCVVKGQVRTSIIWEKSAGREWTYFPGSPLDSFEKTAAKLSARGFCPVSISGTSVSGEAPLVASVWEKRPGPLWVARPALSVTEYQLLNSQLWPQGYRPSFVSGYLVGAEPRYAVIWELRPRLDLKCEFPITPAVYQDRFDSLEPQGYRPISISAFAVGDLR